jgi:hypothetical protein
MSPDRSGLPARSGRRRGPTGTRDEILRVARSKLVDALIDASGPCCPAEGLRGRRVRLAARQRVHETHA